ncbi:hypothetical protein ABID22_002534 [Pontibacter aydingkolensis]|uniref:TonB-dependent receptor n=1 Tax=Pontibacter aydingkolensis TaxID=1911536 RepID=A0ABS7CW96_9BACT|nr:TonB-dependent receptor [Pontibacter aydingkolensis]MBW7468134.1 TonB-dependent receptor [Pontibacter aydingkolensis]
MKKFLFLLTILTSFITTAYGHSGSIKGTVLGKEDNTALAGASVVLDNTDKGTTTDMFGRFKFANLPQGTYQLYVSYLGYKSASYTLEVKEGETTQMTSRLERGIFDLTEVTVAAADEEPLNTISTIDMSLRPIQNSQDVLRNVPGLFIAQHAGGGKAEQIFLRGFDIDHGTDIRLTVDGMPVNMVSHAHGQGYSDLHFIIPETIESIDFGKGPYRADQGNFATAGYAGFNTRSSLDNSLVKLEAGRFNTYRAVGMFDLLGDSARMKHQNAYLATEYMFSDGYFESPQNFNRLNVFGRYQGMFGTNKILSASLSMFTSTWDASGQIPVRAIESGQITRFGAIDDTEGGTTSRQNANVSLTNILPNGDILQNQVYFVKYDFELYSNFTFFLNDPVNGDQIRQKEGRNIYGYNGSYNHEHSLFGIQLRSEAGIGLRHDVVSNSELSRTIGRNTTLSNEQLGDITETNAYAYLSETLELSPKWSVNAALRFDQLYFNYASDISPDSTFSRQSAAQHKFSPKANVYYTHSPTLRIYASAGIGFHSNDARVSVVADRNRILPSAYGTDLGVIFKPHRSLLLQTALWALDLDQEFVYVGDEGIVEPSGKTRRYGIDVTARYQFNRHLFADADLSLAKPRAKEEPEGNNYIPLAPAVTSTGGISYRSSNAQGFNGSLRYRYLQSRPANEDNSITADGYLLLDAVAGYTLKKFELKLTVENLLNEEWKEAQFDTESRLRNEVEPTSEIHFTPGIPFFFKAGLSYMF